MFLLLQASDQAFDEKKHILFLKLKHFSKYWCNVSALL